MKKIFLLVLLILPLYGEVDTLWTKVFMPDSAGGAIGRAVAVDHDNNYVIAGYKLIETYGKKVWVLKLDPNTGDTLWTYAPDFWGSATDVGIANDGNYIVVGTRWSSDWSYPDSLLVIKLDRITGNPIWIKTFSGFSRNYFQKVAIDMNGNIVIGATTEPVNSDSGWQIVNAMILKLSPTNGDTIWTTVIDSTTHLTTLITDIIVDRDNNYIAATSLDTPVVYKISSADGSLIWTLPFSYGTSITSIAVDQEGHYVFAGDTSCNVGCLWVTRVNPNNLQREWTTTHAFRGWTYYNTHPKSLIIDKNNYYFIAGGVDYYNVLYPWIIVLAPYKGNLVYEEYKYDFAPSDWDDGEFMSTALDTSGNYISCGYNYFGDTAGVIIAKFTPVDREIMWYENYSIHSYRLLDNSLRISDDGNYLLPIAQPLGYNQLIIGFEKIDSLGDPISTVSCTTDFYIVNGLTLNQDTVTFLCRRLTNSDNYAIARMDNNGCVSTWYYTLSRGSFEKIVTLPDGDFVVAGNSVYSNGDRGPTVARISHENGDTLWVNRNYLAQHVEVMSIALDSSGYVVIGGWANDGTGRRFLLLKINPTSGNAMWINEFGGTNYGIVSIDVGPDGNYFAAGINYDSLFVYKIASNGNTLWSTLVDSERYYSKALVKFDRNSGKVVLFSSRFYAELDGNTGEVIHEKWFDSNYHGPLYLWMVDGFVVDNGGHYIIRHDSVVTKLYGSSPMTGIVESPIREKIGANEIPGILSTHGLNFDIRTHGEKVRVTIFRVDGRKILEKKISTIRGQNHLHFSLGSGVYFIEVRKTRGVERFKAVVVN